MKKVFSIFAILAVAFMTFSFVKSEPVESDYKEVEVSMGEMKASLSEDGAFTIWECYVGTYTDLSGKKYDRVVTWSDVNGQGTDNLLDYGCYAVAGSDCMVRHTRNTNTQEMQQEGLTCLSPPRESNQ